MNLQTQVAANTSSKTKPKWHTYVASTAAAKKGYMGLAVIVSKVSSKRFSALAVETSTDGKSLQGVLDNHSHKLIGDRFKTRRTAQEAGTRFIRAWLSEPTVVGPVCSCDDINLPKRSRKRHV